MEEQGLCIGGNPGAIAATSPLWREDIEKYGPWRPVDDHFSETKGRVSAWLSGDPAAKIRIVICGECVSGMDVAWRFIQEGIFSPWDSILAVSQTAGRGRHGRVWLSPPGNLHAACCWPAGPDENFTDPGWKNMLSLVAGYVLAKALHDLSGIDIRLKWPNDLLAGGRKIGGILTEVRSDHVVVGIGINVDACPPDADLRHDFAVPATHLAREGFKIAPLSLWTDLAGKAKFLFEHLTRTLSPSEFISVIRPLLAWIGKSVSVVIGSDEFAGVITGISPDGGLRLNRDGSDIVIYSGSIVPIEDQ
jgi:BirA family biotin operon repressor/biotin-[acetyl-CoA-carboxylase] ligase